MTVTDLCSMLSWEQIVTSLGGPLLRHGRCEAWFREGDNKSALSFDDAKGVGYDFATGQGYNKIGFVCLLNHCTRPEAAKILAGIAGFNLESSSRESIAKAKDQALNRQRDLLALRQWRDQLLAAVRDPRNLAWDRANRLNRQTTSMDPDDPKTWESVKFELDSRERADAIDGWISLVLAMTPAELRALRRDLHMESR